MKKITEERVGKQSETRKVLLDLLEKSKKPLSGVEIGEILKKMGRGVNKTTVYRELSFLLGKGVVNEGVFKSGVKHYELKSRPHHHHLICQECGVIEDVASKELEESVEKVEKKAGGLGFEVKSHLLEFYGVCGKCK